MVRKLLSLTILSLAAVLVVGCANLAPEPTPVPPTKTPKPTFTPTPDWTPTPIVFPTATPVPATPTPEPTATPQPTPEPPTPTPNPVVRLSAGQTVNVRSGPGTAYPVIGRLTAGQSYEVTGKNAAGDWLQFQFDGRLGWVTASLVTVSGDLGIVQVAQNIPPPPTVAPRPTARPQPTAPPPPPPTVAPQKHWMLVPGSPKGEPQCGTPYFKGQVQYKDGRPQNGVCLLLDRYGPRVIKYSGSDGTDGAWGFTPCGEESCGQIKIYVIPCPPGVDAYGLSVTPGMVIPPPESDIFEINMTDKCQVGQWTNIIFRNTRE